MKKLRWLAIAGLLIGLGVAAVSLFVFSTGSQVDMAAEVAPPAADQAKKSEPASAVVQESESPGYDMDDDEAAMGGENAPRSPKIGKGGKAKKRDKQGKDGKADGEQAQTRSWFPETFLFEPLVVTDESGNASVGARVPDRLTTWRVLGLAHSRQGTQAGAVASFLGTLPTYVEPIVPPQLRVGDRVRLPIQVVNTTEQDVSAELRVDVEGVSLVGSGRAQVATPAQGSVVRYVTLEAESPGRALLRAGLGSADAVARTLEVVPVGRPVSETRSGTLAAARSFAIAGVEGANPRGNRVRLQVFPGALALLRSELGASAQRGGLAEDAFALLLAGTAPELLRALGDEPDDKSLRALRIVVTQRVVRYARVLDMASATLLARAALTHGDDPVLSRIGERALAELASKQSPDGTCGGETGWPLQRLLVATADCARAASSPGPNAHGDGPAGAREVVIRASGAFERHSQQVRDPYTAAAILASGAARGDLAKTLRDRVLEAIVDLDDGAKALSVPKGVLRADGAVPSRAEATALAILALAGEGEGAPLADLGATLLASYSPAFGWGDGRANLVCMEAVLDLFKDPIPDNVAITLSLDGQVITRGVLDRSRVREVVTLDASASDTEALAVPLAGEHQWEAKAEPAVPGLGFTLSVTSRVPWQDDTRQTGLELAIAPPKGLRVGQAAALTVQAAAPSGSPLRIDIALPAGVQVDAGSLEALVANNSISRHETPDGAVVLYVNPLQPAQAFSAALRVIPTLAGSLQSGPAFLSLVGSADASSRTHVAPARWTIE